MVQLAEHSSVQAPYQYKLPQYASSAAVKLVDASALPGLGLSSSVKKCLAPVLKGLI